MSRIYTIKLINERDSFINYGVFVNTLDDSTPLKTWMNVWMKQSLPPGGTWDCQIPEAWLVWAGVAPKPPAPGVVVCSDMSLPASLGTSTSPGSTFEYRVTGNHPQIEAITPSAPPGSLAIQTGADIPFPNDKFVGGLAKINNYGQPSPVTTITPLPNIKTSLAPRMNFFIAESQQQPGEIVDYDSISRKGASIDFGFGEGSVKRLAVVTNKSDGSFTVKYFDD